MPAKKKTETEEKSEKEKKKTSKKATTKETKEETDKKDKLAELKKKALALEKKVKETKKEDLAKKVKGEEEQRTDTLVPIEDYLKSSIHLGTRVITPDMRPFVYKRRADGLAVFNTNLLDEKLKEGAEFLSKFPPEKVIIVCKREAGWRAVNLFSKLTGVKTFTKKYPAGVLTNPNLSDFIETDLILICDPWIDKNAMADSTRIKIPILSICDTNNYTKGVTQKIIGNNKSAKSLGMIFYLLAKIYIKNRKIDVEIPALSEWIENWDNLVPPK
jgi:small subunit ribosomal protein S2